jgi:hypothetical protein
LPPETKVIADYADEIDRLRDLIGAVEPTLHRAVRKHDGGACNCIRPMKERWQQEPVACIVEVGEGEQAAGVGVHGEDAEAGSLSPLNRYLDVAAGPAQKILGAVRTGFIRHRDEIAGQKFATASCYARTQKKGCGFQPITREEMTMQPLEDRLWDDKGFVARDHRSTLPQVVLISSRRGSPSSSKEWTS